MWELQQKQSLPLNLKISLTKARIRQWINEYGEDGVYVSFSGGKDSTVLLDLVRQDYPEVKAVFLDTGLEYPEIRDFVKTFDNVDWIKPKMNFREIIDKYGYPMIGKEVSECIYEAKKYLTNAIHDKSALTDRQTDRQTDSIKYAYRMADILGIDRRVNKKNKDYQNLKMGIIHSTKKYKYGKSVRILQLEGKMPYVKDGVATGKYSSQYNKSKYAFFLNAPFSISNRCCIKMKKEPAHKYQRDNKANPMTAQMAVESRLRTSQWIKHGCNMFDAKNPISNPMSFWLEQDVYQYIKENNLKIASVYGDIVVKDSGLQGQVNIHDYLNDYRECEYCTTGCARTGCMFCGYGCHLEKAGKGRFERMAITHPQLYDYVMRGGAFDDDGLWKPANNGLGYWFVLKWINIHGGFNIVIPNYEHYEKEYGNELTQKYLYEREQNGRTL